jgi:iron complex transport system ATP-binding protein
VEVLGNRLGRVDIRALRSRIAIVSDSLARALRPSLTAAEIVLTGRLNVLEPWWADYTGDDRLEARRLLADAALAHLAEKPFGLISEGERKQVLLARALMAEPDLLLLDEPAAGLDLGARERLVTRLASVVADDSAPPTVLVTHHTEEIPPGATHAALLRGGRFVASGPIEETLTDAAVSDCFGVAVRIRHEAGRWSSRAAI